MTFDEAEAEVHGWDVSGCMQAKRLWLERQRIVKDSFSSASNCTASLTFRFIRLEV